MAAEELNVGARLCHGPAAAMPKQQDALKSFSRSLKALMLRLAFSTVALRRKAISPLIGVRYFLATTATFIEAGNVCRVGGLKPACASMSDNSAKV